MAETSKRKQTLREIAAEEVFERHNEVYCVRCRETFVVEELTTKHSWQCPHCEKQNPNLYFYFMMIGALLAINIITNLTFLVLYIRAVMEDVNVFYVMWSSAHMLLIGYVLIAIYGDRHSYGLVPLRYLIPTIYISTIALTAVYQIELTTINIVVGVIIFGGVGAFLSYAFYLSYRMVKGHAAEETIIRPVYSIISIILNVLLLLMFTTIAIKTSKRTPGTSNMDFGREGGYVPSALDTQNLMEEIEQLREEEIEIMDPEIKPDLMELKTPEIREVIEYEAATSTRFITKKEEEEARQKVSKKPNRKAKYQQRFKRDLALKQGGGSDKTEWAVLLALRWLKKHQNQDGSWGKPPTQAAMTGLALLCFLGHGEDHLSKEFGYTVRSAINWFVEEQDEKGYFANTRRAYQHGIATYAMAEAYGMTDLDDLRPVVDKAVKRIIEGQTRAGGWVYMYATNRLPDETVGDTSVSGWQIQALKAANSAGISYSDGRLKNALRLAIKNIQRVYNDNTQTFGYIGSGGSWEENYAMTATGVLSMQFLGRYNSSEVRNALKQMKKNYRFDWKEVKGGRMEMPLYSWYYATQAFYQATGNPASNSYWRFWNPQMQKTLLAMQNQDGHWEQPPNSQARSHIGNPDNSDVWATSLCCLMLEVYYRYLPTYRLIQ